MYPNNILFNKNNIFSKISIKHNSSQHNHFLKKKKKINTEGIMSILNTKHKQLNKFKLPSFTTNSYITTYLSSWERAHLARFGSKSFLRPEGDGPRSQLLFPIGKINRMDVKLVRNGFTLSTRMDIFCIIFLVVWWLHVTRLVGKASSKIVVIL